MQKPHRIWKGRQSNWALEFLRPKTIWMSERCDGETREVTNHKQATNTWKILIRKWQKWDKNASLAHVVAELYSCPVFSGLVLRGATKSVQWDLTTKKKKRYLILVQIRFSTDDQ